MYGICLATFGLNVCDMYMEPLVIVGVFSFSTLICVD